MAEKWAQSEACAWTAGIIDGEGSISIIKRKRSDRTCLFDSYWMKVVVGNTDRRMLEKLVDLWGGAIYRRKEPRVNRADSYHWYAMGLRALKVLQSCRQYLVTKSEQADLAIAFQLRMSNGLGFNSGISSNRRSGLSQAEIAIRVAMFDRMKELNTRPGVRQWQKSGPRKPAPPWNEKEPKAHSIAN